LFTKNHIRQRIAWLLLGLLTLMQINSVIFRHAHRLSNGQIITHAHPYNLLGNSCPLSANPHTTHELLLLDALSNPAFLPAFVLLFAFLLLFGLVSRLRASRPTPRLVTIHLARPRPRGPPGSASFLV